MQLLALIGKKTRQSQGFLQNGTRVPLTAVNVMGNVVTQIKTNEKEGYSALQLGIGFKKKPGKRDLNRAKKAGLENAPRFFKEVRVDDTESAVLGSELNISEVFAPGDIVDVTGTSKGKGFAGGVKRHGFKGGPRTHGQSDRERAPGSIGQTTTPGRVYKGKRMAGRMGTETVTIKNLEIIEVTPEGILLIKGLVPGNTNGLLTIKKVGENKKFVPLYKEDSGIASESSENQASGTDLSHSSDDAQAVGSEQQSSESPSLNDSSAPDSEDIKVNTEPAVSSSQNEQVDTTPEKSKEEKRDPSTNSGQKEVAEDAKS